MACVVLLPYPVLATDSRVPKILSAKETMAFVNRVKPDTGD